MIVKTTMDLGPGLKRNICFLELTCTKIVQTCVQSLILGCFGCACLFGNPTGPSSEPYLSGDTWRHHVNHVLSDSEIFDPRSVHPGDSIFVEQDSLEEFGHFYQPLIPSDYILITANCDRGGDEPLPGKYEKLLNDPHLYAWFTQNLDRAHPKLYPIPIGLANQKYPWGNIRLFDEKVPLAKEKKRIGWIYLNFTLHTNFAVRKPCWDYFIRACKGWVHIGKPKNAENYLAELSDYAFVASPPGNGLDTHRTWETLLLGSYPIVLSSTLNSLYENLPVVVVNTWQDVTTEFLIQKYNEFRHQKFQIEKLYFPYWLKRVEEKQKEIRNRYTARYS